MGSSYRLSATTLCCVSTSSDDQATEQSQQTDTLATGQRQLRGGILKVDDLASVVADLDLGRRDLVRFGVCGQRELERLSKKLVALGGLGLEEADLVYLFGVVLPLLSMLAMLLA